MSLRLRLTLVYTGFLALVLVIAAGGVYILTERSLMAQLENRVAEVMRTFVAAPTLEEGFRSLQASEHAVRHEIVGYYYARPSSATEVAAGTWQSWQPMNPTGEDGERLWDALGLEEHRQLVVQGQLTTRIRGADGELYVAQVRLLTHALDQAMEDFSFHAVHLIALPASGLTPILGQLAVNLAATVIVAFVLFALGVWLLSGQALRPVKQVTAAASRISSEELARRVPVPRSQNEMSELALAINHMLERLQESFETQRRFTADASHELRTPVTAIVGHANYLLRRTKPSSDQLESLEVIRSEGERMAKLVNDLLELARADAGFSIQKEPMNLVEVVEGVAKEVRHTAEGTQVSLSIPSPILEVCGDAGRLKQVVLNLVQNAINAGSKHVSISLHKEKEQVHLEILDDGPGIPEEAIPFLFDRFYRIDSARSTRGNGSGLGLAIVKWIVLQHGGDVKVQSRLGEGTAFSVILPAFETQQAALQPQPLRALRTS